MTSANTHRQTIRLLHIVWAATALPVVVLSAGCVQPPLRGSLPPAERATFRADAVKLLQDAAVGDEPALCMNAIEALAEVAPTEGLPSIEMNIENAYAGASFAALMALGTMRHAEFIDRIRTRSEHPDANVRIAALFALHRLGDQRRTGELADYLLNNRDGRIRANAALAIGRLGEPSSVDLLQRALKRERKDLVRLQIHEALAIMGDREATKQLVFKASSSYPDQATLALTSLAIAKCPEAEDVFRLKLGPAKGFPEINLAAARGLGMLGDESGLDMALAYLQYNAPRKDVPNDPPEVQIGRIRGLAALALEAIGDPEALRALYEAFQRPGQPEYVRIAIARAAIHIIDRARGSPAPGR